MMPTGLRRMLSITDAAMLLYWAFSAAVAAGWLQVAPGLLYKDYDNPILVAWNWSFLPLDLGFAVLGLLAVARARRGLPWAGLAIISLALTSCAGTMAISFWALRADLDWAWWLPNLALALLPWLWLPSLVTGKEPWA